MEESRVCPICETENPPDAIHCEVCGERLVPEEPADDGGVVGFAVEESDANEVVGFAVEASEEEDEGMEVSGVDATSDLPVVDDEEPAPAVEASEADSTDDEMLTAAPADETAALEAFDEEPADDADAAASEPEPEHEEEPDYEVMLDEGEEPLESASPADDEGPDYLYSPVDGAAYPRGSVEYEDGFGPNGEELVATPPALDDDVEPALAEPSGASMDDDELAAAAAPSAEVSAEFKAAFQARRKERAAMEPLPQPGTFVDPAVLTVYSNRQPVMRLAIDMDEVLIGRRDPVADSYPDLDLTELDPQAHLSRKHAYIYRQNKNYTLYAVSNAGTQLNSDLLGLGDRRPLKHGDVIVLAGKIAMKFELPSR